ncbi:hypothetical protein F3Y22_tig00017959pilonHSYRG00001 [Hibiscus syriacus]|uniref:Uncharacterized protein n=1 Tax=Hibiscus syriacus TaxID=106335 RepID=A0A6A3BVZ4_HIBSY|nr:hypothetical protein F3Y22_tig00017959pilonHSYRG00001 [Hibiscus syriacus]
MKVREKGIVRYLPERERNKHFADQQTNTSLACTQLDIGMEINEDVKRDEVEMLVRELMVGEKGIEMKAKAIELKKKAKDTSDHGGSSSRNLETC